MLSGLKVIDAHLHFPVGTRRLAVGEDYVAEFGEEKAQLVTERKAKLQAKWRQMYGLPTPETTQRTQDEYARLWADEVEKVGLDRVVFLTGKDNDSLAEVVKTNPEKFVGFAHNNPFLDGAADELERGITELGLKGYKISGVRSKTTLLDDKSLYPIWEVAEQYEIPVIIHFGPSGGLGGNARYPSIEPIIIHDIAKGFPGISFIVPHFGCGYPTQLLQLMWACDNVYTDTSGSNEWVRWMMPEMDLKDLFAKFVQTAGAERILFGTDSSWFPRGFAISYFEDQLKICRRLNMSDDDIEKIFYKNAERIMRL